MRHFYTSLMYHRIESPVTRKISVTPENFECQIRAIKDAGVKSKILGDPVQNDKERRCLLTFDDGHKSNLKAAEVLKEYGFVGYFYVVKDYSLRNANYMSEDDIRYISSLGHKIGVHGKDHKHWTSKAPEVLISELKETKEWIEMLTAEKCQFYSVVGGI